MWQGLLRIALTITANTLLCLAFSDPSLPAGKEKEKTSATKKKTAKSPTRKKDEFVDEGAFVRFSITYLPSVVKVLCSLLTLCEVTVILYAWRTGRGLLYCAHPDALTRLSYASLIGNLLLIAGAALRLWCFATLRELFTFHIGIREGHKLIKEGPYAVVRHPSYTGIFLMNVGAMLAHFAQDGVLRCLLPSHVTEVMLDTAVFAIGLVVTCVFLARRTNTEEALLSDQFGEEWEAYADATPRFLPF